jgi:hypothetical protein
MARRNGDGRGVEEEGGGMSDQPPLLFDRRLGGLFPANPAAEKALGECLVWTGARSTAGYGQKRVNGKLEYVHRLAAQERFGPIPEGMQVDHLCRNRACYNPYHLEIVTCQENVRRGNAGQHKKALLLRDCCNRGHALTTENIRLTSSGARECRTCRNEWQRQYRRKKREAADERA